MICVRVIYDVNHQILGFHIKGHAQYDDYGKDIICSAVSALAFNTINSIEEFTTDGFKYETGQDGGLVKFKFTSALSAESVLLMKSFILGLENIKAEYGEQFVQLKYLSKTGKHQYITIKHQEV